MRILINIWIFAFVLFVIFNFFRISILLGIATVAAIIYFGFKWLAKSSMRKDSFYTHKGR